MHRALASIAGACALASGLAYVAYWPILDRPDWAITAWNLLIIPAALFLGIRLATIGPIVAASSAAAGIATSVMWAFGFRNSSVEPWWIALGAVWWLGTGSLLLRSERRATGWLTVALGIAAGVDFVVTLLDLPLPLLALGGLKLPLSMIWSIWTGVLLLRGSDVGLAHRASR